MNAPAGELQPLPGGSHCSPGSIVLLPQVGSVVLVVVAPGDVVVVVVVEAPHVSQQLVGCVATQLVLRPQAPARRMWQRGFDGSCGLSSKQATKPGPRPQVDFEAHRVTTSAQR